MKRLILTFLLFSCSRHHPPKDTLNTLDEVLKKRDAYMVYAEDLQDEYGWLPEKCDGLLFNSLASFSGFRVSPLLAEKSPGEWQRHPAFDCYPDGAASTISRDMFRGLLIVLVDTKHITALERINKYGEEHNWFMGEAKDEETAYGRTLFTPKLVLQLTDAIKTLSLVGIKAGTEELVIIQQGFGAHLDVLSIYLDSMIYGSLTTYQVNRLHEYAVTQPRNALFQALYHKFTDGDQNAAIEILMDESLFPSERLPESTDHCAHYLWERDMDDELWDACDRGEVLPGIDLMFAAKIIGG